MVMARHAKGLETRVEAILVNSTPDEGLASKRVDSVAVSYRGMEGESHSGLVRESCVRVRHQYPMGTEIRNTRQVSILSVEEMAQIAETMGVDALEPEWVGANLLVSGIPAFSQIPPSTRMIFESGASLVVDLENSPCKAPGEVIERFHPGFGDRFAKAAVGLRGVTAWVEREGRIHTGDSIRLYIPPQRNWDVPA